VIQFTPFGKKIKNLPITNKGNHMTDVINKIQLTEVGLEELNQELAKLKDKEPAAVDRVTKAREFGDLSENSEYHAAREDLAFIQGRIEELEDMVARAQIVKNTKHNGHVDIGCEVTVHADGQEHTFTIVGEFEADPLKQKISHDSPLGKALMGRKVGETVEFEAPVGKVVYTIKKIH
jgi:transcription elongation factor GreA